MNIDFGDVDFMYSSLKFTSYQSFTKLRIQFSVEYAKRLTSKLVTCNIFMFVIVNFVGFLFLFFFLQKKHYSITW